MNYSEIFDKARDFYTSLSYNDKYGKAKIPFRYFLELTYRCNLQCPYCYVGKESRHPGHTSLEDCNSQPYAHKDSYGNTASPSSFKHTSSG